MDEKNISSAAASALWQRAAQLQAQAAHRLEEQAKERLGTDSTEGLSLTQIKQIASESGIDPDFVQSAFTEALAAPPSPARSPQWERLATYLLGTQQQILEVSQLIPAAPEVVYPMLQQVFSSAAYGLTFYDTLGETLVFDVPPLATQGYSYESLSYYMTTVDIKQLFVTIQPVGIDCCEIKIQGYLQRGRWMNTLGCGSVGGISAGIGGGIGALIGTKALALGGALLAFPGLVGAGLLGAGALWGYRAAYHQGITKGEETLAKLLRIVAAQIRTKGAFPLPQVKQKATESMDTSFLIGL